MSLVIAITGICGMIGQTIRSSIVEREEIQRVIGIDLEDPISQFAIEKDGHFILKGDSKEPLLNDLKEKYVDVVCDISESSESVLKLLTETFSENKVDIVIHLAGQGNPHADFITNLVPQNIIGTQNVLLACKNSSHPIQKVIFASTNHALLGHITENQIPGHINFNTQKNIIIEKDYDTCKDKNNKDQNMKTDVHLDGIKKGNEIEQNRSEISKATESNETRSKKNNDFNHAKKFEKISLSSPMKPDSLYAVSKIAGETLCTYYSEICQAFDVISLIIGWCQYDDPSELIGTSLEAYIRCLWLSKRDTVGFFLAAIFHGIQHASHSNDLVINCARNQKLKKVCKHTRVFCVSNNKWNIFNMEESMKILNYTPKDDVEDFFIGHDRNFNV